MSSAVRFLATWVLSGALFWLGWSALMTRHFGRELAFKAGLPAGILFGAALAGFQLWVSRSQAARRQLAWPLEPGERMLREGMANHRLGREYRGGWLRLTDRRLLFRPHAFNFQNDDLELSLSEISGAEGILTLGIIPNGLRVRTAARGDQHFVVYGRGRWRKAILSSLDSRLRR